MAIKMNTTRTIERASSALTDKCEATKKNMHALLAKAGCADAKKEKVVIPLPPGCRDDVQYVGLNGADFYFMRGVSIEMAQPIAQILRDTGYLPA